MAVALDTDRYPILKSSAGTENLRIKGVDFGDGYKQTVIDGINYEIEEWNLQFQAMETAKANTLRSMLKNSLNGTRNLLSWTPPGDTETKYWSATDVRRGFAKAGQLQISCKLKREYPLVV